MPAHPTAFDDPTAMFDCAGALTLLRLGDSAFPAGGFAFSWGLEGLMLDGLVEGAEDLDEVIRDQLVHRWNSMDRPLLARAFAAADLDALAALDRLAEAAATSAPSRDGSRRAGRALLGTSARLGHPRSIAYRSHLEADARLGHLAVVQGLFYGQAQVLIAAAQLLSAWTLVNGLVSAAARLGLVGHVAAQHALAAGSRHIARIMADEPQPRRDISGFTPMIDIAVARKAARPASIFAT